MGMIGGGRDAFIGAVHRAAAQLDGKIELVAGSFSSTEKIKIVRQGSFPGTQARIRSLQTNSQRGSGATPCSAHRFCFYCYA